MLNRSQILIVHVYITIPHSFMYRSTPVLPVIARHLVYCVAIRVHALIALGAFSFARVRVHVALFLVTLTWVILKSFGLTPVQSRRLRVEANPLLLLRRRDLSPSCTSMHRRARPCASIRVHAVPCAPMRLLVGPERFIIKIQRVEIRRNEKEPTRRMS